eukprot:UN23262
MLYVRSLAGSFSGIEIELMEASFPIISLVHFATFSSYCRFINRRRVCVALKFWYRSP